MLQSLDGVLCLSLVQSLETFGGDLFWIWVRRSPPPFSTKVVCCWCPFRTTKQKKTSLPQKRHTYPYHAFWEDHLSGKHIQIFSGQSTWEASRPVASCGCACLIAPSNTGRGQPHVHDVHKTVPQLTLSVCQSQRCQFVWSVCLSREFPLVSFVPEESTHLSTRTPRVVFV